MLCRPRIAGLIAVLALLLGACQSPSTSIASSQADPTADPARKLPTISPRAAGVDPMVLEQIARDARRAGSTCLLVARRGKVVGEWYWHGGAADQPVETFSTTKSVVSVLVGIAAADGDLALDTKMSTYFPNWAHGPSRNVTVGNIVSNDSGRRWSSKLDYQGLLAATNRTKFAARLGQQHEPGTTWNYNNAAIQTLSKALLQSTGKPGVEYADQRLFEPLGMANSRLTTDPAGNTMTFMGLQSTCPDLSRFGDAMLHRGRNVIPPGYIKRAKQPSQDLNVAYGYLFWLNKIGRIGGPFETITETSGGVEGQLIPGAPEDLLAALGYGNQVVLMDPDTDIVVVRLGAATGKDGSEFTVEDAARVITQAHESDKR